MKTGPGANTSPHALRHDGLFQSVAVWIVGGTVLAFVERPLIAELTPFLMLPLWAAYAALGVGLIVAARVRLGRPQLQRAGIAAMALAVSFAAVLWLGGWRQLARAGDALEFRLRFSRVEPRYAALVPELLRDTGAAPDYRHRAGVTFVVDSGPPKRLAFLQPGSFLDNWEAIVYDPTGAVGSARGWRYDRGEQEFTAPPEVRRLFGGDMVVCDHVRGPWFRCWFT